MTDVNTSTGSQSGRGIVPAPSIPTLSNFLTLVRKGGLARRHRFMVVLHPPASLAVGNAESSTMTMLCESVIGLGKSFDGRQLRINAMSEYRAGAVNYNNQSLTLTFILDTVATPAKNIGQWMDLVRGTAGAPDAEPTREVGFYTDYIGEMEIFALVPSLQDAGGPTSLTPADLSNTVKSPSIRSNILNKGTTLANKQLGILTAAARSHVDPRAFDLLRDTARILNVYNSGSDPFSVAQPEYAVWGFSVKECWPREISPISWSYSEIGNMQLTVSFNFKWWEFNGAVDPGNTTLRDINPLAIKNRNAAAVDLPVIPTIPSF